MFSTHRGHVWHMVLMVGIVVLAFWFGAGIGGAALVALLACTAMMIAMVWIAMRPTRVGAAEPGPHDAPAARNAGSSPDRWPRD